MQVSTLLSRRRLLGAAASVAAVGLVKPATAVSFAPRSVSLYNIHTGEWLRTVYWADGHYIREAVRDINWILRDHDSDEIRPMNAGILDLLGMLRTRLESHDPFLVVCGYRSPATNQRLYRQRAGVAKHSFHIKGHGHRLTQRRAQHRADPRCGAESAMRRRGLLPAFGFRACRLWARAPVAGPGTHLVTPTGLFSSAKQEASPGNPPGFCAHS